MYDAAYCTSQRKRMGCGKEMYEQRKHGVYCAFIVFHNEICDKDFMYFFLFLYDPIHVLFIISIIIINIKTYL